VTASLGKMNRVQFIYKVCAVLFVTWSDWLWNPFILLASGFHGLLVVKVEKL